MKALREHGLETIETGSEPFDPSVHEAMMQQPSADHPVGTVLEEFAKGYRLRDRVLRPSKVIVSQAVKDEKGDADGGDSAVEDGSSAMGNASALDGTSSGGAAVDSQEGSQQAQEQPAVDEFVEVRGSADTAAPAVQRPFSAGTHDGRPGSGLGVIRDDPDLAARQQVLTRFFLPGRAQDAHDLDRRDSFDAIDRVAENRFARDHVGETASGADGRRCQVYLDGGDDGHSFRGASV
ncbi:MAG: nucleotide exchange factor GrpE, partial [Gemmatimonadetes bacterium]|nr:nucleotide exchange factor GrpE [Gemmatimonadota bacterium]